MPCPYRYAMTYDPEEHHRRSIRLKGYDYSQPGAYFVTVCTNKWKCLFGEIVGGTMVLNQLGQIVSGCWNEIPEHFPNVELDEFVTMPNHLHGIVVTANKNQLSACRGTACRAPTVESFGKPVAGSLSTIMRSFKSAVTKEINKMRGTPNLPIWQRNYYEHVLRNEDKLNRTREYVLNNPLQWQFDRENPRRIQDEAYDNQWGHFEGIIYGKS